MHTSQLVEFYRGRANDREGRLLSQILEWDDDALEEVHDFIQWLFPLSEPSLFNPDAPLLTAADIAAFHDDPVLQENLRKSFGRIVTFLGLTVSSTGEVIEGPTFAVRRAEVWDMPNHNWLRITRILKSLRLLGLEAEARSLFVALDAIYCSRRFPITAETYAYWENAMTN